MTYYVERCTERTLNGSKWEPIPGTDHDELDEAYLDLMARRDTHNEILRIGRKP